MFKIFILFFYLVCFQTNDPVISWQEEYKLSWANFKAKPEKQNDTAALTASGITFGFSITETDKNQVVGFTSNVHAHFYPEQSWFNSELIHDDILAHEQLHFDITELYARKFRERILKLKINNSLRKQLKKLHIDINFELAQLQNQYDKETDHSRNSSIQLKWIKFITAELKKLEQFKPVN